jgi:endo-alpha-1,4-polygalactosaminidase (GH114 family)
MRSGDRIESDDWTVNGPNIMDPEKLERIRRTLEQIGPIIVEHWFYYGSRAPKRLVFDDYEEFLEYLQTKARAGDTIHVWDYAHVCRDENELTSGKCPDHNGQVPLKGAY